MKRFEYQWNKDFFLLHIQMDSAIDQDYDARIHREYEGGNYKEEIINARNTKCHRFIISRTHPSEIRFSITYPDDIVLEAFELDDRAYYPTESFYKS